MKKILSIILCLSMLMSSAVFAAPVSFAPIDVESAVEIDHTFTGTENEEAELSVVLPAIAPVATYPANGASDVTVGDPAYKVTFSKAINPEDVTIENLGVAEGTVAGIYLDEGTNTVYLFPDSKKHDAVGATVSFPAIQSNISTADGANCLYFPAVSYSLNGSHGNDGENMVTYGNMEYGWVPLYGNDPATMYTEADGNHAVKIGGGSNGYKYFYVPVHFEPYTEYTYSYKIKTLENDSKAAATIRYSPSDHSDGKTHFGKGGNVNKTTWTTITATHTTGEVTSTKGDSFANYVEPSGGKSVEFLVDDIVITKKVKINFAAGRNTVLNGTAPATLSGYNGETVTLPTTDAFATTDARWAIFGWTDGENTYNGGQEYTINGGKTLTPYVVALEDTMKVSFTSNMNGITLPETVEIFAGDSIDLTTSEFQFDVVGYWFDGWAVKGTDEIITSITPDADVELEAKFSYADYWDFTKKAHYDTISGGDNGNALTHTYDAEKGAVCTPLKADNQIETHKKTITVQAEDYSKIEVTLLKSSVVNESLKPELFFLNVGDECPTAAKRVVGAFDRTEGNYAVYSFDMNSNTNWAGAIKSFILDPFNAMDVWTIKGIKLIRNAAVESVEITDVEVPAVRMTPDTSVTAASNANYTVKSVTWTPAATIFAPETEYTVNVTVAPAKTYCFDAEVTTATINGEAATVTVNVDKTATVSYTFDATEALIPVTVTADKSVTAITEDGGTIELSATVETVDSEDVIDTYDVIWSVDDDTLAYIEGNVLHAFNNGKVTVTATSVYDASKSDSFEVEISGQTLFPVTFHAGTVSSGVTNLPEGFNFKGVLDLTKYPAPVRSGYTFMGWKTATYAEETATSVDVYAPTTIYASWAEGQSWEFNTDGSMDGFPQMGASKDNVVKDGCYSFVSTTNDPNGGFWSTLNINADKFKTIEVRMHSSVASYMQIFFRGTNATTIAEKYSVKHDTNANADGEFSTYVFDMGSKDGWSGTVNTLRFDFVNKKDATVKIDYVRILNNVEEFVDIGGIDEPSVMAEADTDAEALAASKFEVKSFEWEQNLIDGKYFDGGVAYTAKVVVAAKAGVQIANNAVATVNGNTATITKNADGTYTVEYTFPATETLTDVKVVADETKNAISVADGKITLSAKVIDVATGEDFADQGIEWSVDNTAACTLEGNVLTAVYDAEVNVTATSTYNRAKKATYKVTITNQIPPKTLTFHKGTNAAVSGMPASVVGKKPVDLTQYAEPVREGYIFNGWALDKAGKNIVTSVDLTSDVTVYAMWKYGISWEFNTDGKFDGFDNMSTSKDKVVKDGYFAFTSAPKAEDPSKTDPNVTQKVSLSASEFKTIEVRLSANIADAFKVYFVGTNATLGETNALAVSYDACKEGEFVTLVLDMGTKANWTGTINQLRFDPTDKLGATVKIDYIRVVRDVCEFVDITDVTVPVAKAVADLDAKGANEDLYVVKGVEWSPALLYKQYHDGEVAYTANVTVAAAKGSMLSTAPIATVNGKEATVTKVNSDGSVVVSYTFPKTGVIDNKDAVEITLNSKDNSGNIVPEVRTVFVGETFALGSNLVTACPEGMRWVGWAETDGDASTIMDSIVTVKDVNRTFYAQYEEITEFDFANKYHHNITVNEAKSYEIADGAVTVVAVDELSNISAGNLKLDTLDYASVEVIVDKALTTTTAAPVIKFNVGNAWIKSSEVAEITYEGNAAYKYTFHPVNEAYWTGTVNSLAVNVPEEGQWAVRSIKFIPTKAVSVTIEGAEIISRPGRVIEYSAKIKVLDGTSIPRTDIAVEIVSMLDENGVAVAPADFSKYAYIEKGTAKLYPVRDCTLTIRGTSNYNKRAYDEIVVEIKNQGEQYLVSYDLNASGVTGSAPASELAKGSFTPSVCTATRNGYFFSGWSTDPDDANAVSESFNITENTTLYAIWGKGNSLEFNTASDKPSGTAGMNATSVDTTKGVYTSKIISGDPQYYINSAFDFASQTGGVVNADRSKRIEMRFATDALVSMTPCLFFQNTDPETGEVIVGSYGATPSLYVASQTWANNALTGGDLTNFQTVVWDMSSKDLWRGIITNIRLDPTDSASAVGKTIEVDYIRFIDSYRDVKFNANGGTITKGDQVVSETTESANLGSFTVPFTPEKVGSKFVGWSRSVNGTSKVYTSGSVKVADDVTFYAIWAPTADITNESSVTVTNGSGTVYNNGSALVYEGDGITVDEVDYRVADAATVDAATDTTLLMKLSYSYKSMADNSIKLIYDDANGQPQETIIASGLPNSMDSGYVLVKLTDPAITPAITGNITNVRVEMPEGVANSIAVEELTITDYDTAYSIYYDYMTYEAPEVEVSVGNAEDNANPKTYAPSTQPPVVPGAIGGGTPAGSTVGTNNNSAAGGTGSGTSMIVPSTPTAGTGTGTGTGTSTPVIGNQTIANNFKFKNEYNANTFTDVKSGDWFYGDVEKSYKLGLMNGKGGTIFDPNGAVTIAEAVTVAARIYAICVGKTIPAAKSGEAWYTPNVNYAIEAKIIKNGQFADYTAKATRKQVAEIFANCAPSGWLNVINMFTSIPDVDSKDASFKAILSLYNAGILTGVDASYKFNPAAEIKRSEMSAIINRVAIPESRIRVVTEVEKTEAPFISGANGDEATLAGFYTGGNSKISSVADPTDSTNEVYQIKIEKQGKVWSYLWHKMKFKAGETYKIEADIYLVSDFNGNPLTGHSYGLAFKYEGKDHGFGGGRIDSGKWVHVSKEYTVPASYQAQVGTDAFGIYMDPYNDNGVTYLVDNLSVLPASGSVEIGGSSTSSTGSSAGTTSANAATSVQFKSADDFSVFNIDGLKVNGSFKGTSTTNDANVVYKKNVNLNASEIKQIKIVAKIPKGKGAEVFFTTDSDKALSGSKRYGFTSTSDDFATYTINTSSNEHWKGTIVQFRFDPVIGEGIDFEWKSIEFVK